MAKYNFYLSYTARDGREYADALYEALTGKGYRVFCAHRSLSSGVRYAEAVVDAISETDYFIPIVTEEFTRSPHALNELNLAFDRAQTRAIPILPVVLTADLSFSLRYYLSDRQFLYDSDRFDCDSVVARIEEVCGAELKGKLVYEKLSELLQGDDSAQRNEALCQAMEIVCARVGRKGTANRRDLEEVCRLLPYISGYHGLPDAEKKAGLSNLMSRVRAVVQSLRTHAEDDLISAALMLRIIFEEHEILAACVDEWTGGDVTQPYDLAQRREDQEKFREIYESLFPAVNLDNGIYSEEDVRFLRETGRYIFSESSPRGGRVADVRPDRKVLSEDEEILQSVANFMQEGNKLFDVLQAKGMAGEEFLKCLLTSYERLKNYCRIVGASEVASQCIDRIAEIRQALAGQPDTASAGNETAENGIRSLLGLTVAGSGDYDVFISFKSEDSDMAEKIYHLCQEHLLVPFWSKLSLPALSKSEYASAIDSALDRARHFVVVLSDLSYMEADWVKYEMESYRSEIREGRKPDSNFIIVATDSVYDEIIGSNKKVLPYQFRSCQIIRMSEYRENLPPYLR